MKLQWTLLSLLLSLGAHASEIDNISTHYLPLRDSNAALDGRVQRSIREALASTRGCNVETFAEKVSDDLVSMRFYSGAMERFAWNDPGVERIQRPLSESIYSGTPLGRSVIGLAYGLDPILALSGTKIGTDKVGHFIDHGFSLFKRSLDGASLDDLANHSIDEEEGAFGFMTTGIKSYADMAANMDGFLFWRDLYGKGDQPFVRCEAGRLVQVRDFRFADYVNDGWDEALNCNQYNGESLSMPNQNEIELYLESVDLPANTCEQEFAETRERAAGGFRIALDRNVQALEKAQGKRFTCPVAPSACGAIRGTYERRYGKAIADKIVSPACR